MRFARRPSALLGPSLALFVTSAAQAGGFDLPDNGTQALGRGGAFVAKADDPTAIYFNPAGLARQRGTRLLFDGNVYLHSFTFRRLGAFRDDPNNPATPWGGRDYPGVSNTAGPFFLPFAALATDFGSLDRLTVAAGVFSPPTLRNRTFPLGVANAPAASRYDYVQSRGSIWMPTLSAAFRVTRWLDLGLSGHLVLASFDDTMTTYVDDGTDCPNPEFQLCDSRKTLEASATSFAATLGTTVRPIPNVAFGLAFRTPISLEAKGTLTPGPPTVGQVQLLRGDATLSTALPWILRGGARYVGLDRAFEIYDLEVDVVYEAWNGAQDTGARLRVPRLGDARDIDALIVRGFKNTVGIRLGGGYNIETRSGVFSLRAGSFFDSAATAYEHTRIEYDTLAKIAGTVGLGYKQGALGIEIAYAAVASMPRVVGTGVGVIHPLNDARNGRPVDGTDQLLPAINEGAYRGFTHIISLGATLTFDAFFGGSRAVRYGNPYEPDYVPPEGVAEPGLPAAPPPKPSPSPATEAPPPAAPEPPRSTEPGSEPVSQPVPKPAPAEPSPPEPASTEPAPKPPPKTAPKPKPTPAEPAPKPQPAEPAPKPAAPEPPPKPAPEPPKAAPPAPPKPPPPKKPWWDDFD